MSLPTRDEFRCEQCIYGVLQVKSREPYVKCRLMPIAVDKDRGEFCSQGQWHFPNERSEILPYLFGEWEK